MTSRSWLDRPDAIGAACLELLKLHVPTSPDERIVGRTWDLKSAYKELAAQESHLPYARMAVQHPQTGCLHLVQLHNMPFGAVASVHAFLRCSEAYKYLARSHLLLVVLIFFDDSTMLTRRRSAEHAARSW